MPPILPSGRSRRSTRCTDPSWVTSPSAEVSLRPSCPKNSASGIPRAARSSAGSVSGGCVESDVYENAMEVLASGEPKLLHYGITDDLAWSVRVARAYH